MSAPLPRKISDFKRTLTNLAQTSHYEVRFGAPPGPLANYLSSRGVDQRFIAGDCGLLCYSTALPFAANATVNVTGNFTGVTEKFAHTRIYTPINMEFYVDKDYKVIKFLEHWMEFMNSGSYNPQNPTSNSGGFSQADPNYFAKMQYPDTYKMDQTKITKFERDYLNSIEYTFFGLFPRAVSPVSVGYDQSRTLVASASFEYTRYVSGRINSIDQKRGKDNNKTDEPNMWDKLKTPINFAEASKILQDDPAWANKYKLPENFSTAGWEAATKTKFVAGESFGDFKLPTK